MAPTRDIDSTNSNWFNESKLAPVRPKIDLVRRDRLLEKLDEALGRRLLLVVAPPGYGKSTLLIQWAESLQGSGTRDAWLLLDGNDADSRQLLAYIALSLFRAGLDIGELEIGAQNGFSESSVHKVLAALAHKLTLTSDRFLIILDDYHLISNSTIDVLLQKLIWEMPTNVTFVVSSRARPNLDMPTMIAAGEALEIGAEEIRLNKDETLQALGKDMDDADADEIFHKTEGWPVAVQLARVQKRALPSAPLNAGGSSTLIASYLTDQVLDSLEPDVRDMLLDISVLDQFNADVANAIRDASDSAQIMERMQPLTALLVSLDSHGDWYRLHHLFAEYLQDALRKQAPERTREILVRACDWCRKEGQLLEAVKYAAKAGDEDLCAEIILAAGGWKIILTEGIGVMRAIFRFVPAHLVSSNARLLIAQAYLHCKDGEYSEARGLLDMSVAIKPSNDAKAFEKDHKLISSLMALYEDQKDWIYVSGLQSYDEILDHHGPLESGTLLCEQALIHLALGDLPRVDEALRSSIQAFRTSGSVLGLNYSYLHACVAALYRGDIDMAHALTAKALELAESNFGSDSGLKHMAQVLALTVDVWSDTAKLDDLETFSQTLSYMEEYDGWTEIFFVGFDAAVRLAERHQKQDFAQNLIDRLAALSQNRRLDRLESLVQVLTTRLVTGPSSKKAPVLKVSTVTEVEADLRSWQLEYLCAETVALKNKPVQAQLLRDLIAHAELKGLFFHSTRLRVALAISLFQSGVEHEAVDEMVAAIKAAAQRKLSGIFMLGATVLPILKAVRSKLRTDDSELLTVNYVSRLIQRVSELTPNQSNNILSPREREIIEQVAIGQSNKEIARSLDLTENTIKFHLKSVYRKLKVNRRTQAIAIANELGILD